MLWYIIKRESFEQISSLRFALAMLLTVFLMIVNALGHIGASKIQQTEYRQNVSKALTALERDSRQFYNLVIRGPGVLYKTPSALSFCAHGSENNLPASVLGWSAGWGMSPVIDGKNYPFSGIWRLKYTSFPPIRAADIFPIFLRIDWTLIIANILSFLALIFTFDAVAGEMAQGTLRLTLSNSVARRTLLTGKFLSNLFSLGAVFMSGVLINLLLLYLSGNLQLNTQEWYRIGGISP